MRVYLVIGQNSGQGEAVIPTHPEERSAFSRTITFRI